MKPNENSSNSLMTRPTNGLNSELPAVTQSEELSPEAALVVAIERTSRTALMNETPEATRELLAEIRRDVSLEAIYKSPCIAQMKQRVSETTIFKLVCFIICDFQLSMKFDKAKVLTNSEIIDLADWFLTTYTHDTIKDLILALKESRTGRQWFGRVSMSDMLQVIEKHFEKKADYIEALNSTHRSKLRNPPNPLLHVSNKNSDVKPINEQQFDKWSIEMIQFLPK